MIRIAAFVAISASACALYAGDDPPDEPSATSSVHAFDLPQDTVPNVDVLFVIDDTTAMATVRDRVLASVPAIAAAIDRETLGLVHVGVITSNVDDRGLLVGRFVSIQRNPDGTTARTGELVNVLQPMFDVGTTGTASQPLAAIELALAPGTNPGFRRADADLLVIPITNRDDDSIGAVDDYLTAIPTASIAVSGVYARPAPRLDAFLARFTGRTHFTSIVDGELATAADALQGFFLSTLPLYCFDTPLVEPFDCAMSDVVDGVERQLLRACDASATNAPCWTIHADPLCMFGSAPTNQRLEFRRSLWPLRDTHVIGQCATKTLAN